MRWKSALDKTQADFNSHSSPQRRNWVGPLGPQLLLLGENFRGLPHVPLAPQRPWHPDDVYAQEMAGPRDSVEEHEARQEGQQRVETISAKEPAPLPKNVSPYTGPLLSFHPVEPLFSWEESKNQKVPLNKGNQRGGAWRGCDKGCHSKQWWK